MDEVSGGTKVFQSYNRTFISIPARELVVVPVGSGSGGSRIHVSLSNQGGLLESFTGNMTQMKKNWTFTSFSSLRPAIVPVGTETRDS
jgi:hypothetical protein